MNTLISIMTLFTIGLLNVYLVEKIRYIRLQKEIRIRLANLCKNDEK